MCFVVCLNCCNDLLLLEWGGEHGKTQRVSGEIRAETVLFSIQFLVVEEAVLSPCSHLLPLYAVELLPISVLPVGFRNFY